jgi:endogenous inhibitor of DNA gyrase (YacG/DUF329 family)
VSKCPICGKESAGGKLRAFCSKRCADIDLGRWLGERYVVQKDDPDADPVDLADDSSERAD